MSGAGSFIICCPECWISCSKEPREGNAAVAIMWWGFWAKFAGDIGWFTTTRSPYWYLENVSAIG